MRFVNCSAEFRSKDEIENVPSGIRGIYVLLNRRPRLHKKFDVVYIGNSVWPRIPDAEVAELEGLFRHIYRRDTRANKLARQKTFGLLRATRENDFHKWNVS